MATEVSAVDVLTLPDRYKCPSILCCELFKKWSVCQMHMASCNLGRRYMSDPRVQEISRAGAEEFKRRASSFKSDKSARLLSDDLAVRFSTVEYCSLNRGIPQEVEIMRRLGQSDGAAEPLRIRFFNADGTLSFESDSSLWCSGERGDAESPLYKGTALSSMARLHTSTLQYSEGCWKFVLSGVHRGDYRQTAVSVFQS